MIEELNEWRAAARCGPTGRLRVRDSEREAERPEQHPDDPVASRRARRTSDAHSGGLAPLPPVVPHTLRRTYISLMLEAGAPLHYVMDQVGHEDSKTTLEIYAPVQKRVNRPQVKRAFEELLARTDVGELGVPADARARVSHRSREGAKSALGRTGGPLVVHKSGPQTQNQPPEDDLQLPPHIQKAEAYQGFPEWARLGSNQRPLACEASALPLSYAPGLADSTRGPRPAEGSSVDPKRGVLDSSLGMAKLRDRGPPLRTAADGG